MPKAPTSTIDNSPNENRQEHRDNVRGEALPEGGEFLAWILTIVTGSFFIFVALTCTIFFNRTIESGTIAGLEIKAPRSVTVVDSHATEEAMQTAKHFVVPVFQEDYSKDKDTQAKLDQFVDLVKRLQNAGIKPNPELNLRAEEQISILGMEQSRFETAINELKGKVKPPTPEPNNSQKTKGKGKIKAQVKVPTFDPSLTLNNQRQQIANLKLYPDKFPAKEALFVALSVAPENIDSFSNEINDALKSLSKAFKRFPVEHKSFWKNTVFEFLPESWSLNLRKNMSSVISHALEPNLAIDPIATKQKADSAARGITPVVKNYKEGDILVRKGEVVSEEMAKTFHNLGIAREMSLPLLVALSSTAIAAMFFTALVLFHYEPRHFFSSNSLSLMFSLVIVALLSASTFGRDYPQFVPLPAAALNLAIFFGRRVSLAVIIPLMILVAVNGLLDINHLMALGFASLAAIFAYSRHRHLTVTGFLVGIAQAVGFTLSLTLIHIMPDIPQFLSMFGTAPLTLPAGTNLQDSIFPSITQISQSALFEFFAGLALAILAIGVMPFLEDIFGLVTPQRLAELAEADQPLLKELEEKAPGTYQHSLAVANLAEAGAKAIKADVVLVRAGAMYHDIGKMVKPKLFIENQLGAKNPHDLMTPEDSRDVVLAHVTDGLELARKYALPKAVRDFIPMHQGTTLMAYFYSKAIQRDGKENVDALFYRYPGPKPSSKETAIVMLADVSEAVTHSMKDPSEEEVDVAISRVFENRWDDGQFDESTLTHDELEQVKLAFVRVWRTLHHERLKYPSTTTGRMAIPGESLEERDSTKNENIPKPESEENQNEEETDDSCHLNAMPIDGMDLSEPEPRQHRGESCS
ncbi:MAG: HDIG domain-containing protein [Candidatus Melainabacteria bacterium]|nr:HDIG domain-containing protein [Candidatus Melainabacteria bacterium]